MVQSLAKLFSDAQSSKVEWEGSPVYAVFEISPVPTILAIEFLSGIQMPVQGIRIKVTGGVLVANDEEHENIVLWRDTSPLYVPMRVKSRNIKKMTLKIWNTWRGTVGGVGVSHAWLGNAGMRVEASTDGRELILRCSDGEGPVDFADLQLRSRAWLALDHSAARSLAFPCPPRHLAPV